MFPGPLPEEFKKSFYLFLIKQQDLGVSHIQLHIYYNYFPASKELSVKSNSNSVLTLIAYFDVQRGYNFMTGLQNTQNIVVVVSNE